MIKMKTFTEHFKDYLDNPMGMVFIFVNLMCNTLLMYLQFTNLIIPKFLIIAGICLLIYDIIFICIIMFSYLKLKKHYNILNNPYGFLYNPMEEYLSDKTMDKIIKEYNEDCNSLIKSFQNKQEQASNICDVYMSQ